MNFSQAAENNKVPILEKLQQHLSAGDQILEVGSGSGQHGLHFAQSMPQITWQPTDQGDYFPGLKHNINLAELPNVRAPHYLDLSSPKWPGPCNVLYCANVIHIMSETLLPKIFESACDLLLIYGPYKYDGEFTSDSNARFDLWLKDHNLDSGIRDIEVLKQHAERHGYQLISDTPMPANNQFLVLKR